MERVLSIVIPVYNEEDSIEQLHTELTENVSLALANNLISDYEILFVNDGSSDASENTITEIISCDDHVILINLRRNFGKADALEAGFSHVRGDVVVTMDADLQDNPEDLIHFIEAIDNGYDLVSGWKYNRKDPLEKRLPSRFFNKVTSLLSGIKLHDFNCGYKAYRRQVVDTIHIYGELHRYIPLLAKRNGFRITEIKVNHRKRRFGKSKYGFSRYLRGFFDSLTTTFLLRFHDKPMYFFGFPGLILFVAGVLFCAYLTILWFYGQAIGGRPLLILGVLCIILGIQFIFTGLLADMIVDTTFRNQHTDVKIKNIVTADEG